MDAKSAATPAVVPAPLASTGAGSASNINTSKPKPCCVCKEEKSKRDECMLFSTASDPAADCQSLIQQYKSCMLGFGYNV